MREFIHLVKGRFCEIRPIASIASFHINYVEEGNRLNYVCRKKVDRQILLTGAFQ